MKIFLINILLIINLSFAQNNKLIIFHAGSFSLTMNKIIEEFKKENPNVKFEREIAGSRECARKITELNKNCDVFVSSDYLVIEQLLFPQYADWYLKFANNEIVIAYNTKSKKAKEINSNNWWKVLLDKNITIGRSDPNSDPCGYRTVITLKLAEKYYAKKNLAQPIILKNNELIRPKEIDLISLLDLGEVDYIFIYRSVAEQLKLNYLQLPKEINLSDEKLNDYYKSVSLELSGKNSNNKIIQFGEAISYGVTIPKNSLNKNLAIKFLEFMLEKNKGIKIIEKYGQKSTIPSNCVQFEKLPNELKKFALKSDVKKN
ncbi:MAG: extracellular solute-binding protein [Melioribacteraceae bacterium]|nr:extracellular solute-binding protein [Melioribacteraceae bacterium]